MEFMIKLCQLKHQIKSTNSEKYVASIFSNAVLDWLYRSL